MVISSRTEVARSAQQTASIAAIVLIVGASTLLERSGATSIPALLRIDAVVILAALMLLAVGARAFRRDRLFEG